MISSGDQIKTGEVAAEVRRLLEARRSEMVDLLGELVGIESPSDDPEGLDRMADRLEGLMGPLGDLQAHPTGTDGCRHLVLEVAGRENDLAPALVLAHYDTVWPRGTIDRLPFAVRDGMVTGPGCVDMKGGLVLLHHALQALHELAIPPRRRIRVLMTCDEEVRSPTSRPLISRLGEGAALALVLEPPLPQGVLKTARKGSATYRLEVQGRAAHAGVDPENGVSAVAELALQVLALAHLSEPDLGTSVNVGVVRGGTRPNVVAARAEAEIDVRTATMAEARRVDTALRRLRARLAGAQVSVVPDLARPPMEATAESTALFDRARRIAAVIGMPDLRSGSTGGVSDGNLVAALGVPTLDGLGPEGGGAHADTEHVVVESLPRRAALLAGLLAEA